MSFVLQVLAGIALALGLAAVVLGSVGLLRFPDFYSRLHAVSVTDTAGAGFILLGLALGSPIGIVTVKLALVFAFMIITGPTAAHALAKAALHGHLDPMAETLDLEEDESSKP